MFEAHLASLFAFVGAERDLQSLKHHRIRMGVVVMCVSRPGFYGAPSWLRCRFPPRAPAPALALALSLSLSPAPGSGLDLALLGMKDWVESTLAPTVPKIRPGWCAIERQVRSYW